MRNKKIIFSFVSLIIVASLVYGVYYFLSLRTMVINFSDINSVAVFKTSDLDSGDAGDPIVKITSSGQEIELQKGEYTLRYDAKKNFQDLFVEIDLQEEGQVVELQPDYTEEFLDTLLENELGSINKAIKSRYSAVENLYNIKRGELYMGGDWYGAALVYKGSDPFNSDNLRVVLKKENGHWSVKTNPPDIYLSKFRYPNIPVGVLKATNSLPAPTPGE